MSQLQISIVDPEDIETHVRSRADFVRDMLIGAPGLDWDLFYETTRSWMKTHLGDNSYLTYTGYLDGNVVSCAGILLYTLPPLPGRIDRLVGHVLSFYTYPPYRRRGFGTQLIEYIKADTPKRNITRLVLNAAPMGELLYRKAGFSEQDEKEMVLQLG